MRDIHGLPKDSVLSLTPLSQWEVRKRIGKKGEEVDVIFKTYSSSGGVKTNRDAWVYNFNRITSTH